MSVSGFIWFLKGKSALLIFERHANLKYKYGNRTFWCREYYVDIAGKNDKAIAEYIRNQLKEDKLEDQLTNLLTHLLVTSNNLLQMADITCGCRRCQYHRALSAYGVYTPCRGKNGCVRYPCRARHCLLHSSLFRRGKYRAPPLPFRIRRHMRLSRKYE